MFSADPLILSSLWQCNFVFSFSQQNTKLVLSSDICCTDLLMSFYTRSFSKSSTCVNWSISGNDSNCLILYVGPEMVWLMLWAGALLSLLEEKKLVSTA